MAYKKAIAYRSVALLVVCISLGELLYFDSTIGNNGKKKTATTIRFVDVALEAGIRFKHKNGATGKKHLIETMGSGCALLDYDNDGYLDIYLVNGASIPGLSKCDESYWNRLYRNNGNSTFTDVTERAGVRGEGYGMGVAVGDYDNDGYLDIYITNYGPNMLYHNNGDGTFTDVTRQAGVGDERWGSSAGFFDYDNDGDLDLFVTNYLDYKLSEDKYCGRVGEGLRAYCHPDLFNGVSDVIYRNNGDGTFSDISEAAGIKNAIGKGLGVTFGDYNNDGYIDIYVANDSIENFLFKNNGDGTFTDVGLLAGVAFNEEGKAQAGMGVDFGDYDNDGWLDIFVTNFDDETNTLYRNEGNGFFTDMTFKCNLGLNSLLYVGWGTRFFDYDNDGDKDIFITNGHIMDNVELYKDSVTYAQEKLLFENVGRSFCDVSKLRGESLLRRKVGRGAAFGDIDNDGDIDILVTNSNQEPELLINHGGNENNWLMIQTVGTKSNRDGIGARIEVIAGDLYQMDEIKGAASYLSHNDLRVFFGLGKKRRVGLIKVRWPSGVKEELQDVPVNQLLIIKEGTGLIKRISFKE